MNKFYQFVKALLQVSCTVEEYRVITKLSYGRSYDPEEAKENYSRCVPYYTISRCPYCGQIYQAQFDTYSISGSAAHSAYGSNLASATALHETSHCKHYLACDTYNYLHELSNIVINGRRYHSRKPHIQQHLLPDDIESCAVMHALPICNIENDKFVPRFTKFILVYFDGSGEKQIFRRNADRVTQKLGDDPEYFEHLLRELSSNPSDYDLVTWINRQKLKWLDIYQPELPLQEEPIEQFPYVNIIIPHEKLES